MSSKQQQQKKKRKRNAENYHYTPREKVTRIFLIKQKEK